MPSPEICPNVSYIGSPEEAPHHIAHGFDVTLAGQPITLPFKNVSRDPDPAENPVLIAYFNPNESEALRKAGAREIADRLIALETEVVLTPTSHKSELMVREAAQMASKESGRKIKVIFLPRGPKDQFRSRKKRKEMLYPFTAVTSNGMDDKYMDFRDDLDEKRFRTLHKKGAKIAIVDDVISTGGTINAIKHVAQRAINKGKPKNRRTVLDVPVIAVMEEAPLIIDDNDKNYSKWDPQIAPDHHVAIVAPVLIYKPKKEF